METEKGHGRKIVEVAGDMIENSRSLITLNIVERVTLGASWSLVGVALSVFAVFTLLFVGLGSAWWLGEAMDNMKAGFFIVGGFYLFIILFVALTAKSLIIPSLRNLLIKKAYDDKDN